MKRLTVYVGAGAMFVALLTAPLFHFHDRDDHGSRVSLVHAHFLGSPASYHHSDNAAESRHSHDKASWVEFFTFDGPQSGFDWAIGSNETLNILTTEVR